MQKITNACPENGYRKLLCMSVTVYQATWCHIPEDLHLLEEKLYQYIPTLQMDVAYLLS